MNPSEERVEDDEYESSILEEDLEGDMSTDASTVQLPKSPEPGDTPTATDSFKEKVNAEENLTAMLAYLMDEVSKIRLELKGRQDASDTSEKVESGTDVVSSQSGFEEDLESISTTN